MINGSITYIGGPKSMKRGLAPILKEALQDAGGLWHRRYLPMHFKEGSGNKYKYKPRTQKYMRYKRKKMGHRRPLEFTGTLRRETTRMATISGSSKRMSVTMSVGMSKAWYAGVKYKSRGTMPDLAKELTTVTRAETKKLAKVIEITIARKLNAIQTRESRA